MAIFNTSCSSQYQPETNGYHGNGDDRRHPDPSAAAGRSYAETAPYVIGEKLFGFLAGNCVLKILGGETRNQPNSKIERRYLSVFHHHILVILILVLRKYSNNIK